MSYNTATTTAFDNVTEFENLMSLDNPIKSSTITRWERKQRQQQLANQSATATDRYIPNRSGMDFDLNQKNSLGDENFNSEEMSTDSSEHAKLLLANTINDMKGNSHADSVSKGSRVLSFKNKAPAPVEGYQNSLKVLYSTQSTKRDLSKPTRHIPSAPVRILDAPDMLDDYYLNLLSWSCNNVLGVALSQCVYLWDASTGGIKELMNVDSDPNDYISSLAFLPQGGSHLAIGTAESGVQLWDVQAQRYVSVIRTSFIIHNYTMILHSSIALLYHVG
jgi:cell division cycle protein 20 (cofactor of APC complex)